MRHHIGAPDLATAPLLLLLVDGQIDGGHADLHLDLASLGFLDVREISAVQEVGRRR